MVGGAQGLTAPAAAAETPVAAAAAAPAAAVRGLSCPACGGALEVAPGLRVLACPFCGTHLLATGEAGVRRFSVEPKLDAAAARGAAVAWLAAGWNKDPRLKREAEPAESFLCFLPFFRIQADAVGLALGTEERRRTVGSGKNRRTETYEVDVERTVEREFDETSAAVQMAEWGVQRVNLVGDRLLPHDAEALESAGMVFPPTRSEVEARAAALARCREEADPAKGMKRVRFRFLETLRERLSVIWYPLWVVRYRFRGRSYQVLVDAEDGSLAYGKAPGNDLYRALMLVGAEAAACFLFTSTLQHLVDSDDGCGVVIGAGALALAILAWGWRRFRWGGEVVEGSGVVAERAAGGALAAVKSLLPRGSFGR
ncbi:MAG TPA: hypothetical protein VGC93_06470 [Thermoanaerobaculia bacterium]